MGLLCAKIFVPRLTAWLDRVVIKIRAVKRLDASAPLLFTLPIHGGITVGAKLLKEVVTATGLPEEMMNDELGQLVAKAGKSPDDLTLEDLRMILAEYVQDILLAAKDEYSDQPENEIA